jgi:hypothetical protein
VSGVKLGGRESDLTIPECVVWPLSIMAGCACALRLRGARCGRTWSWIPSWNLAYADGDVGLECGD